MSSSGGQQLVSLEQAWRRLMQTMSFVNPGRARQGARALRSVHALMRRG